MNEFYANTLTNEQLRKEILSKGRKANLRLSQLRKSGYYEKNPIIANKWNTYLNTSKYATKAGYFKTGSKSESRAELLKQYLQIRQFLGQKTTVKESKEIISRHAERLGISENAVERTLTIYGNSGISAIVDNSDVIQQFISEMVNGGFTDEEINEKLYRLEQSANTQSELIDLMREEMQRLI